MKFIIILFLIIIGSLPVISKEIKLVKADSEFAVFGDVTAEPSPTPTSVPATAAPQSGGNNSPSGGGSSGGSSGGGSSGGSSSGGGGSSTVSSSNSSVDLNGSGRIDIFDLSILLRNWNKGGQGDINKSGKVDIFDLSILLRSWSR